MKLKIFYPYIICLILETFVIPPRYSSIIYANMSHRFFAMALCMLFDLVLLIQPSYIIAYFFSFITTFSRLVSFYIIYTTYGISYDIVSYWILFISSCAILNYNIYMHNNFITVYLILIFVSY